MLRARLFDVATEHARWMDVYAADARDGALDILTFERARVPSALLTEKCTLCTQTLANASDNASRFDEAAPDYWSYAPLGAFARHRGDAAIGPGADEMLIDIAHSDCLVVYAFEVFADDDDQRLQVYGPLGKVSTHETLQFERLQPHESMLYSLVVTHPTPAKAWRLYLERLETRAYAHEWAGATLNHMLYLQEHVHDRPHVRPHVQALRQRVHVERVTVAAWFAAQSAGDVDTLRRAIAEDFNSNVVDAAGESALYRAVQQAQPDVVLMLLRETFDISKFTIRKTFIYSLKRSALELIACFFDPASRYSMDLLLPLNYDDAIITMMSIAGMVLLRSDVHTYLLDRVEPQRRRKALLEMLRGSSYETEEVAALGTNPVLHLVTSPRYNALLDIHYNDDEELFDAVQQVDYQYVEILLRAGANVHARGDTIVSTLESLAPPNLEYAAVTLSCLVCFDATLPPHSSTLRQRLSACLFWYIVHDAVCDDAALVMRKLVECGWLSSSDVMHAMHAMRPALVSIAVNMLSPAERSFALEDTLRRCLRFDDNTRTIVQLFIDAGTLATNDAIDVAYARGNGTSIPALCAAVAIDHVHALSTAASFLDMKTATMLVNAGARVERARALTATSLSMRTLLMASHVDADRVDEPTRVRIRAPYEPPSGTEAIARNIASRFDDTQPLSVLFLERGRWFRRYRSQRPPGTGTGSSSSTSLNALESPRGSLWYGFFIDDRAPSTLVATAWNVLDDGLSVLERTPSMCPNTGWYYGMCVPLDVARNVIYMQRSNNVLTVLRTGDASVMAPYVQRIAQENSLVGTRRRRR